MQPLCLGFDASWVEAHEKCVVLCMDRDFSAKKLTLPKRLSQCNLFRFPLVVNWNFQRTHLAGNFTMPVVKPHLQIYLPSSCAGRPVLKDRSKDFASASSEEINKHLFHLDVASCFLAAAIQLISRINPSLPMVAPLPTGLALVEVCWCLLKHQACIIIRQTAGYIAF